MIWHEWFSDGQASTLGFSAELVIAALYLRAAARRSPRGRRWPVRRTIAFLAGLLVLVLALDSGIAAHDQDPIVHTVQHALLMMLAPLLLAYGKPVTLALRTLGPAGRRRLLAVLHDPAMQRAGRRPVLLVVDYSLTMAVVMLGPIERLAERHFALHIAIHCYLIICGAIFWTIVLAQDPVPNRRPASARVAMSAACIPVAALLSIVVASLPGAFDLSPGTQADTVALILLFATTVTSAIAITIIAPHRARSLPMPRQASAM